jgi:putative transcriptional regulator
MIHLLWRARTCVMATARTAMSCLAWSSSDCSQLFTRSVAHACGSSRPGLQNHGNDGVIMRKTVKGKVAIDWSRVDAMSESERHAAAMADPDARPMTDEEWARAPRVPQIAIIRHALKLSQEQFAAAFHIPVGTIRDWEQGRYEPDAAARAYLRVIARVPGTVRKALGARTKSNR